METRLLIVGVPDEEHVGAHFLSAARDAGIASMIVDSRIAYAAPSLIRALLWRIDRIPARRGKLRGEIVAALESGPYSHALFTGIAPIRRGLLAWLESRGCGASLYLTDDPWNKAHRAQWFFDVLPEFKDVITTRRSNESDLRSVCRGTVRYMPFAYDPRSHFPVEHPVEPRFDVTFVGNPDRERVDLLRPLFCSNLRVGLFGLGWENYTGGNVSYEGYATAERYRKAVAESKVSLLLVRRANRDGHVMRTYELAAQAACILAEKTTEHVEIFGEDGECVRYFSHADDLVRLANELSGDDAERSRLAAAVRTRIAEAPNTYRDRLVQILEPRIVQPSCGPAGCV